MTNKKMKKENHEPQQPKEKRSKLMMALPILLILVAVPLSMLLWIGNLAFTKFWIGENEDVTPIRWLMSVLTPVLIAAWGLKKHAVSISGAIMGLFVGFILTLSSYLFLSCLFTFFITGSKVTKFRSEKKRKLEKDFKEGGQRDWTQVICNSGMAAQLALLYILDSGCGERLINFRDDYRASWLALGVLGSFACCNGDTWASELGTVIGQSKPFLITTFKRVPKGTNGGVSLMGIIFSFLGGLVIGAVYYVVLLCLVDSSLIARSPPQWPIILWGGISGFLGSLIDSLLGATVQYSGLDKRTGIIVEYPGKDVKHISGYRILDNHSVNLLSSIIIGVTIPHFANILWPLV
uniref:Transmembrane protein 19 n=1 Tax=Clastoptera arizonana TaxID=38151 RepID=A0A1B6DT90_9HEMI